MDSCQRRWEFLLVFLKKIIFIMEKYLREKTGKGRRKRKMSTSKYRAIQMYNKLYDLIGLMKSSLNLLKGETRTAYAD